MLGLLQAQQIQLQAFQEQLQIQQAYQQVLPRKINVLRANAPYHGSTLTWALSQSHPRLMNVCLRR